MFTLNKNICRLCCAKEDLQDIFLGVSHCPLQNKIETCTALQISKNDNFPNKICSECCNDLEIAYNLKVRSENTNKKFKVIQKYLDLNGNIVSVGINPAENTQNASQLAEENKITCQNVEDIKLLLEGKNVILVTETAVKQMFTEQPEASHAEIETHMDKSKLETLIRDGTIIKCPVGRHIAKKKSGPHPKKFEARSATATELRTPSRNLEEVITKTPSRDSSENGRYTAENSGGDTDDNEEEVSKKKCTKKRKKKMSKKREKLLEEAKERKDRKEKRYERPRDLEAEQKKLNEELLRELKVLIEKKTKICGELKKSVAGNVRNESTHEDKAEINMESEDFKETTTATFSKESQKNSVSSELLEKSDTGSKKAGKGRDKKFIVSNNSSVKQAKRKSIEKCGFKSTMKNKDLLNIEQDDICSNKNKKRSPNADIPCKNVAVVLNKIDITANNLRKMESGERTPRNLRSQTKTKQIQKKADIPRKYAAVTLKKIDTTSNLLRKVDSSEKTPRNSRNLRSQTKHTQMKDLEENETNLSDERNDDAPDTQWQMEQLLQNVKVCANNSEEKDDPNLSCKACKASFDTPNELEMHNKEFHTVDHFKLTCKFCDREFTMPGLLRRHENSHTVERIVCKDCGATFISKLRFKKHLEMHCSSDNQCHVCHQVFGTRAYLMKHAHRVHKISIFGEQQKLKELGMEANNPMKRRKSTSMSPIMRDGEVSAVCDSNVKNNSLNEVEQATQEQGRNMRSRKISKNENKEHEEVKEQCEINTNSVSEVQDNIKAPQGKEVCNLIKDMRTAKKSNIKKNHDEDHSEEKSSRIKQFCSKNSKEDTNEKRKQKSSILKSTSSPRSDSCKTFMDSQPSSLINSIFHVTADSMVTLEEVSPSEDQDEDYMVESSLNNSFCKNIENQFLQESIVVQSPPEEINCSNSDSIHTSKEILSQTDRIANDTNACCTKTNDEKGNSAFTHENHEAVPPKTKDVQHHNDSFLETTPENISDSKEPPALQSPLNPDKCSTEIGIVESKMSVNESKNSDEDPKTTLVDSNRNGSASDLGELKTFICNICSQSFSNASLLKAHQDHSHIEVTSSLLKCDQCHDNFESRYLLIQHLQEHF